MSEKRVRRTNLGAMLRSYRLLREQEQRALGPAIGVSAATICRLEAGYMPDADNLVKLLNWMLKVED